MSKPVLIIDPGHGGKDPGGGSNNLWKEKDKVLEISLYQHKRFNELGVKTVLTRNNDKYMDSVPRTNIVKASGAKYCLSNHINAGGGEGAETIHSIYSNNKLAKAILDALVKEGAKHRRVFTRKNSSGGDWYYMHRMTGSVETVIIEYGFADNKNDTEKIRKDWKKYAEAVVKAFCGYIGHKYVAPGVTAQPKKEEPKPVPPKIDVNKLYRVRKTWSDVKSQKGAYSVLNNAKISADNHKLNVFDCNGKKVYPVEVKKSENLKVDGYLGELTIKAIQRYFGTPVDGFFSEPSLVIKKLQTLVGAKADGYMGPLTIRALQKYLGTPVDGIISKPSLMVKELQKRLNNGKL